ncbi:MAG: tail fiber domain-containing protein [Saprospiraceae bacterium]|nr:tail fiber domain-containing protein [Saprospiraceae bacterium]
MHALYSNTTGSYNIATGTFALSGNTTGTGNTANGYQALLNNILGSDNTAVGYFAGLGAMGVDFTNCTFLGANTYPTQNRSNVTMLGAGITNAECTGDNQVLLGNTAVTQIRANVGSITTYSDRRYKSNIAEDVKGLDFINRLRPVSYTTHPAELHKIWGTPDSLLQRIDHSAAPNHRFTGLIAQEVEQAMKESGYTGFTGIDIPRSDKETYTLRYTELIMPLIKAVQELSEENRQLRKQTEILMAEREENKKLSDQYKMLEKKVEILLSQTVSDNVQKQ